MVTRQIAAVIMHSKQAPLPSVLTAEQSVSLTLCAILVAFIEAEK